MGLLYLLSPLFSVFELQHEKDMHWVSHTENPIHSKTRIAICRWRAERTSCRLPVGAEMPNLWLTTAYNADSSVKNFDHLKHLLCMRMHNATTNSHHHLPSSPSRNSRLAKLDAARQVPILTLLCSSLMSHQCSVDNRLHCASSILATMITLFLLLDHFV